MIRDSGAAAVVASGEHCKRIDALMARGEMATDLPRIGVDVPGATSRWLDFVAWREAQDAAPPEIAVGPDTECNIIYSSGTTGLPKGIVHTHGCRCILGH